MLESIRLPLLFPLALLMGGLSACSTAPESKSWIDTLSPYHFDRVQGNVVTREQLAALKPATIEEAVGGLIPESKHAAVLCVDAAKRLASSTNAR